MEHISNIVTENGITTCYYDTSDILEVNMLRRSVLSSIDTYAIDIVSFQVNTSARHDEIIAHRLGSLVIDNDVYDPAIEEFFIDVEGPLEFTSRYIEGLPVKLETPITTLRAGQKIVCKCIVRQGQGKNHVKWRPVSTFTFTEDGDGFLIKFKGIDMLSPEKILEQGFSKMIETAYQSPINIFFHAIIPDTIDDFNTAINDICELAFCFNPHELIFKWTNYIGTVFFQAIIDSARDLLNMNYNYLALDSTSWYSTTLPAQTYLFSRIFQQEGLNPASIIDATANIGGDTVNFFRLYPDAEITAIEIDHGISNILRRNMENLNNILNTERVYNFHVANMSAVDYFGKHRFADLIYFDPPWGGKNYTETDSIDMVLGDYSMGDIVNYVISYGMAGTVALKLPINANIDGITSKLTTPGLSTKLYKIGPTIEGGNDSILLIIRTPNVMYDGADNSTEDVVYTPSLPIFQGLLAATLIDYIIRYKTFVDDSAVQSSKYSGADIFQTSLNLWNDFINLNNLNPQQSIDVFLEQASDASLEFSVEILSWCNTNHIKCEIFKKFLISLKLEIDKYRDLGNVVTIEAVIPNDITSIIVSLLSSLYPQSIYFDEGGKYTNSTTNIKYTVNNRYNSFEFEAVKAYSIIGLSTSTAIINGENVNLLDLALVKDKQKPKVKQTKVSIPVDTIAITFQEL